MIYFDNAATTPLAPEVIAVMHKVMTDFAGNPSSIHAAGRSARVIIEDARITVAGLLKANPAEIFFTSSGTEAINTILFGAVNSLNVRNIITSPLEHHAVLHTVEAIARKGGATVHFVNTDPAGHISTDHLASLLAQHRNVLVCLMMSNNEIGNLLPLKEVSEMCRENGAFLMSDIVQSVGKMKLDPGPSGIHFAACSGHKFHGPKGVGILYINRDIKIDPLILGGGQERNMRSGTENIYGIAGIAKAMELAYLDFDSKKDYLLGLKNAMIRRLKEEIPDILFNGDCEQGGLINLISVNLPARPRSEMLIQRLDVEGVALSGGSACSSGAHAVSHVMTALGLDEKMPVLRISFSRYNTMDEIDRFMAILKRSYK